MRWLCLFLFFNFSLLNMPVNSFAVDLGESIQLHGFLSQGYLHSSDNDFLVDSQSGSLDFNDMGLNANWIAADDVRFGAQIYYRHLGDYSEDKIVLDWAVADYQPFDWFGLRLGKVKMPLGLYNESRDSDFLLPMVFLPQSIYDESRRDTYLAYWGGEVYGNLPTGSAGDLDYQFFIGETDFPENSILEKSTENSLRGLIARNNYNKVHNPGKYNPDLPSSLTSTERESDELYGGALVFNSATSGLRLGLSLLTSRNSVYANGASVPIIESEVRSKFVVSLEYSWPDLVFVSEYGETDRRTKNAGVVTMDGPSQSWYVMLNYSPLEKWTFSALYDEFYRLKDDKNGSSRPQVPDYMGWRKDIGVAVRYDISDALTFKAEYHNIDGGAMQMMVVNPDGVDRYWNYFAAKLSYSF